MIPIPLHKGSFSVNDALPHFSVEELLAERENLKNARDQLIALAYSADLKPKFDYPSGDVRSLTFSEDLQGYMLDVSKNLGKWIFKIDEELKNPRRRTR